MTNITQKVIFIACFSASFTAGWIAGQNREVVAPNDAPSYINPSRNYIWLDGELPSYKDVTFSMQVGNEPKMIRPLILKYWDKSRTIKATVGTVEARDFLVDSGKFFDASMFKRDLPKQEPPFVVMLDVSELYDFNEVTKYLEERFP